MALLLLKSMAECPALARSVGALFRQPDVYPYALGYPIYQSTLFEKY
jgi:hypothetical protein